uniref:Uncharacterized protein n=1 Tax=Anguilla anguilla TaxID=7936 RepID=A0A0E9XQL4_ANGAN
MSLSVAFPFPKKKRESSFVRYQS